MAFERLKDKETFKQAYLDMLDKTYSKPAAEYTVKLSAPGAVAHLARCGNIRDEEDAVGQAV